MRHSIFSVGNTKCNKNMNTQDCICLMRLGCSYTGYIYKYDWYSSWVECRYGSIHSWIMHQGLVNTSVAAMKETIKNSLECAFHFSWWVYFVMWLRMVHNLSFHSGKQSLVDIYVYVCSTRDLLTLQSWNNESVGFRKYMSMALLGKAICNDSWNICNAMRNDQLSTMDS